MEVDFLSMDNILTGDEAASLFDDQSTDTNIDTTLKEQPEEKQTDEVNNSEENNVAEVDSEDLFPEEKPESVGNEKNKKDSKEDTSSDKEGTSPNFYSSIASALKEEGIFPDLDDETIENVQEAEDFRDLVDQLIRAGLDEVHKRINDALNAGVEPNVIKQYENTLYYLNGISEEQLSEESTQGEQIRRLLLQQDFMNRGYSLERAVKMTEKLFASGEDVEEAMQALQSNKEFFSGKYNDLLTAAKKEQEQEKQFRKKQAEDLKKDIMEHDTVFDDIKLDKSTRQKIYDAISKPVYKDPDTGEFFTSLQKYKMENENEFLKNVGILFTLTDGFKNISKLVKTSSKKVVKSKLKELETVINNTQRDSGGRLKYVGNTANNQSEFDTGFMIDIN